MASVRDTVYRCLIQYPSLFRTKGDVFNHLFLVLGNGYDWIDGELVDKFQEGDEPKWADETGDDKALTHVSPELNTLLRGQRILQAKRQNTQIRFVLENFDAMFEEVVSLDRPYPACNLCHLFTMPEDVKKDWLEAADVTSLALALWWHEQTTWQERHREAVELNIALRKQRFSETDRRIAEIARKGIALAGRDAK